MYKLIKKIGFKNIIIVFILIISFLYIKIQYNRYNNLNDKYVEEISLRDAIQDSLSVYINKYNEIVVQKTSLQADIKNIENLNYKLSENQKTLFKRINYLDKNNKVLAAANIKMSFIIDSLEKVISVGVIDTLNNNIVFEKNNKDIAYQFTVTNVIPFDKNLDVEHKIDKLKLPNEQFIDFHYNKKNDKVISFSIINTNKYMKVYDIDSYVIPEIKTEELNLNFFQRTYKKFKEGSILMKLGVGCVGGLLIGTML